MLSNIGASEIGDLRGRRVLDVGCGVGDSTSVLLEAVGPDGFVTAIDFSPECLLHARERVKAPNVTFVCGDARKSHELVSADGSCNLIFCNAVIWQIRPLREFLQTCRLVASAHADLAFNWCDFFTPLCNGMRSGEWFRRDSSSTRCKSGECIPLAAFEEELLSAGWRVRRVFGASLVESVAEQIEFSELLGLASGLSVEPEGQLRPVHSIGGRVSRAGSRVREWIYIIARKNDAEPKASGRDFREHLVGKGQYKYGRR
jgi:SAM-dependent methyltransferase